MHATTSMYIFQRVCAPRRERATAARERRGWPWDWLALAAQNLRSTRDAVSQGVLRACMGTEAAHLLVEDADVVLDAISFQGVS